MAQNRNIQIQYFNGTDYDTLYPIANLQNVTNLLSPSNLASGTLSNSLTANSNATATITSAQIRNIYFGTTDMTANSSALTTGSIYLCYE